MNEPSRSHSRKQRGKRRRQRLPRLTLQRDELELGADPEIFLSEVDGRNVSPVEALLNIEQLLLKGELALLEIFLPLLGGVNTTTTTERSTHTRKISLLLTKDLLKLRLLPGENLKSSIRLDLRGSTALKKMTGRTKRLTSKKTLKTVGNLEKMILRVPALENP